MDAAFICDGVRRIYTHPKKIIHEIMRRFIFTIAAVLCTVCTQIHAGIVSYDAGTLYGAGVVRVGQFDSTLGVLSSVAIQISFSGYTGYASGLPQYSHGISFTAGEFAFSAGMGAAGYSPSNVSHRHYFSGQRTITFDDPRPYADGYSRAVSSTYTTTSGHRHYVNASGVGVNTTTTYYYTPYSDLDSYTVVRTGFGSLVLPEFDTSVGNLVGATVAASVSGQTTTGPGVDNHVHTVSVNAGSLQFSGQTSNRIQNSSSSHYHSISTMQDSADYSHSSLSLFENGGTTYSISGVTGVAGSTSHTHTTQLSSHTTTTFWYEPAIAGATSGATGTVPEPTTFAIWGVMGLAGFGGIRRRRNQSQQDEPSQVSES